MPQYPSSWTGRGYFPSFPATSPYVTTLGATQGPESGNAEVACQANTGGVITTGGGFSTYNPTPSWQVDAVNAYFDALTASNTPTSGYNRNGRGYPDVSLIGVWYQVVVQGEFISLFGTSASAPVFAAMISLINAARAANNMSSVGFINPTLYAYGQANTFGVNGTSFAPYNDVTQGDNTCTSGTNPPVCCDSGFYATAGWDPVTGFGSVFYPNLAQMFNVTATYVASPSSNGSGNKLSTGAVVGIVLAVIFVVAMLIGACVACCCACNKPPPPQMTQQMAPVPAQVYETQNPVATGTYARPPGAV
jgi:tripeptidyl-peptidase-1